MLIKLLANYYAKECVLEDPECLPGVITPFISAGDFVYCEYYTHCKEHPCTRPETNFQKSHDFKLTFKNKTNNFYIIQYREPISQLISRYKFLCKTNRLLRKEEAWRRFFKENINYYSKFIKKWIKTNQNQNVYYLKFENFISDPTKKVKEIILFQDPRRKIDRISLDRAIGYEKIINNEHKDFKYYDHTLEGMLKLVEIQ